MKMNRSIALPTWALALVSCATLLAEEAEVLDEIVVEAVRGSILPAHVPGNATVIEQKTIEESGARSVADILVARGGLRISSTSGNTSGGTVHMRGFGENSSSRVLLLVDGKPTNRADMGAVSLLEVPISRIARVEILRGSQTARFGDNAVAGVINLITRAPREGGEGYIESAGGSDDYAMFRLGYGGRVQGNGLQLDLERNFTDGWRENAASEVESAALRWDRMIGREMEIDAGFSWSEEFTGFPGPLTEERYKDDPRQSIYAQFGQADQYFSEQTLGRGDATFSFGKTTKWTFEVPLIWSRRDQSWNMGPGFHTDNLLDTVNITPVFRTRGDRWQVEAGASGRYDHLDLTQFAQISRADKTGEAELTRWIYGLFTAAEWEPWDRWHFNAAARAEASEIKGKATNLVYPDDPALNFERSNDDIDWALQLGVRWESGRGLNSWLRYDRLYRLPSTDEIASYQGYPLTVPFNDQLAAETGHQVELGAEYVSGGWNLRLNGFIQWLEGEIAYDYLQNLNLNFADTRRIGAEGEVAYRTARWETVLRYTWLTAEFQDGAYRGNAVYLVPEQEATALLAWRPLEELLLQGEYQFVGSAFEGNDFQNDQPKLPEYGVLNFMVRWEPKPGFSIYGRVNNVLDERYATVKYNGVWYPAAGRQMQVGIRKEF